MKKNIFVFTFSCIAYTTLLANGGSTGLTFLQLGIGARAVAMGEAYTAIANDGSALFFNPAALSFAKQTELMLMHKEWIAGSTTEFFSSTIHGEKISYGMSLNATSVSDIEIRTQPGPAQGTFSARNVAFSGALSYALINSLSIGMNGKYLYEKIFVNEANGYALDFGASYYVDEHLSLGVALANIGSMNELRTETSKLPSTVRAGAGYSALFEDNFKYTFSGDIVKLFSEKTIRTHLGGEIVYNNLVALRAGYQFGYEIKNISTGFGVHYGIVQFDYAFVPLISVAGSTHTFSLTFGL